MIESKATFWVNGKPATFATRGERPWKENLVAQIPVPSLNGMARGLRLNFSLQSLAPAGHPLDVDNLCEPVFSVLVNARGWFGGSRSRVCWWRATKCEATPTGCQFSVSAEDRPELPDAIPGWEGLFQGPIPTRGTSPELAEWARRESERCGLGSLRGRCTLYLGFGGGSTNLGDISTGAVKSTIDCLYPILGGTTSRPDDHRIFDLIVEKNVPGIAARHLGIKLWCDAAAPAGTSRRSEGTLSQSPVAIIPQAMAQRVPGQNPCRPDSCKYVVCEAAFRNLTLGELREMLDRIRRGAGARLNDYINDLRSENGLDVRVEDNHVHYYGRL